MAFMELQSEFGRWYLVETADGTEVVPADVVGDFGMKAGDAHTYSTLPDKGAELWVALSQFIESPLTGVFSVQLVEKWGARYSAPGYMDATDWVLADTQEEAESECREMYGKDEEEDFTDSELEEMEGDDSEVE